MKLIVSFLDYFPLKLTLFSHILRDHLPNMHYINESQYLLSQIIEACFFFLQLSYVFEPNFPV